MFMEQSLCLWRFGHGRSVPRIQHMTRLDRAALLLEQSMAGIGSASKPGRYLQ